MKKTLLLILCVLVFPLLCVIVSASDWTMYQANPQRLGQYNLLQGNWGDIGIFSSITDGSNFQPLLMDVTNDDKLEIIGSDSTYFKIWAWDENSGMSILDEVDMGSAQDYQMQFIGDANNDGIIEFAAIWDTYNLTSTQYNSSDNSFTNVCVNTSGYAAKTAPSCFNISGTMACYWGSYNGSNSGMQEMNMETCGIAWYPFTGTTGDCLKNVNPAVGDVDKDGIQEIVMICDADLDTKEGIIIWDQGSADLDTSTFGGDGILDDIACDGEGATADAVVYGLLISNVDADGNQYTSCINDCFTDYPGWANVLQRALCVLDCQWGLDRSNGGGYDEIVVTFYDNSGTNVFVQEAYMSVYKINGDRLWTVQPMDDSGTAVAIYPTAPVTGDPDGDGEWELCMGIRRDDTTDSTHLYCYDDELGTLDNYYSFGNVNLLWQRQPLVMADMNDDGVHDIVFGGFFYDEMENEIVNISPSPATYSSGFPAVGDLNGDNSLEVCGMYANMVYCSQSDFENLPPTLNNSLNRGGYFGYSNPACLDTTQTFQAQECGGGADCNYENDGSTDQERIVTTCGIPGESLDNGTFVGANPTFDCYYNATGTYNVRLYLQDDLNDDDFSQYNTQYIQLLVIDGIPGVTCNGETIASPSDQGGVGGTGGTAYSSDELSSVLDDLFGADTAFKNMIAIGIIIGVASSAAAVGGLAAGAIAAIAVTVLVMILGLLSVWIMVLLIALMLLGIVISKLIFGSPA